MTNGNAPTAPLHGRTAPLGRNHGAARQPGGGIPRFQGRPTARLTPSPRGQGAAGRSFRGQQPGENVVFIRRKHPFFLILPAIPALLFLLALLVTLVIHTTNVRLSGLLVILEFLFGLGFVVFTFRWLAVDLIGFLFNIYILTDRRLIDAEGFLTPKRKEATLDRIQQVQVVQDSLVDYALHLGDVNIVTAGSEGDLNFDSVGYPHQMADEIRAASQRYGSAGRPVNAEVEPKLPALKKVLDEMAKPIALEAPPAVPLRTFGGFLRRPAQIRLLPNESVTNYIYRHWYSLVRRELIPAGIIILSLVVAEVVAGLLHAEIGLVALVGVLIGLVAGGIVYLNYADDVFILTTDRIVDIDRFLFIFFEGRKQAEYTRVQDVRVNVRSIVGRILNFGDISVETAGRLPNIEMTTIPNPFAIQDLIFSRINAIKERDAAAAANRQRLEYRRMLTATLNELVVEVPDVRQLTLVEASQQLDSAGLQVKVDSERRMRGVPPGVVVAQMPSAQTMVLRDSEVRVILSGR
jgi:uncharacterized membrane protein YdbT with pleckstrin-like domain